MQTWDETSSTLTIDAAEGYCECPAVYTVEFEVYRGRAESFTGCKLDRFTFAGIERTRDFAIAILGLDEVRRQEKLAGNAWWDSDAPAAWGRAA